VRTWFVPGGPAERQRRSTRTLEPADVRNGRRVVSSRYITWRRSASRFGRFGHGGPGGYHRGFGLFRRFFWFALGAGAYAFWSSRHQDYHRRIEGGAAGSEREEGRARRWGCHRRRERESMQAHPQTQWQQPPPPPVTPEQLVEDEKRGVYTRVHVGPSPPSSDAHDHHHTAAWIYKDGHWTSASTNAAQTTEGREAAPVAPAVEASGDKGSWLPWSGSKPSPAPAPPLYEEQRAPAHQTEVHSPVDKAREVRRQAGEAMADISDAALDSLLYNIQALKFKLAEARQQQSEQSLTAHPRDSKSGFGPGPRSSDPRLV